MALFTLSSLLFSKKKIGDIVIDLFETEVHTRTSEVTQYPIESGSTITDHIVNDPIIISVSGIVSDIPTNILGALAGIGESRANNANEAMNKLIDDKSIVTLVTGLKVYQNMVITNFDVDRSVNTGKTLTFSATLQQVEIVLTELVDVPAIGDLENQAKPVADAGSTVSGQTAVTEIKDGIIGVKDGILKFLGQ